MAPVVVVLMARLVRWTPALSPLGLNPHAPNLYSGKGKWMERLVFPTFFIPASTKLKGGVLVPPCSLKETMSLLSAKPWPETRLTYWELDLEEKFQLNLNQSTKFLQENVFENFIYKMLATSFRLPFVNTLRPRQNGCHFPEDIF